MISKEKELSSDRVRFGHEEVELGSGGLWPNLTPGWPTTARARPVLLQHTPNAIEGY